MRLNISSSTRFLNPVNGAGDVNLVEPKVVKRDYPAQWTKASISLDLAELARLRFKEGLSMGTLAKLFNLNKGSVSRKLKQLELESLCRQN